MLTTDTLRSKYMLMSKTSACVVSFVNCLAIESNYENCQKVTAHYQLTFLNTSCIYPMLLGQSPFLWPVRINNGTEIIKLPYSDQTKQ